MAGVEHQPSAGKRAKYGRQNVRGHLHQALGGIVNRQRLVLVLVQATQVDLANALRRRVAEDFGEGPNFQAPIARNAIRSGQTGRDREFSREGIAEAVEVNQKAVVTDDRQQRLQ